MKKRDPSQSLRMKYVFISLILVMAMFLTPVVPAIRLHQVTMLWETITNVTPAQAEGPGNSTIYLPLVIQAGEAEPPAPPAFEIISPANGGTISGMMYFAVQPTDAATVSSVTFKAGSTNLGTDSDASDGFKVFLNASDLPAGTLELSAIGTGESGETTKSITVNVVPNPPSSATVGSEGGVLASEIGSIITLPPDSVPDGTNISVTEMTQEEITTENGFDWDAMGVTFLGAQKIQSNANISKPLGVASAGFGNRVQPGQAVVNYRIAPDADGDGVDELIVVNTASVAPNGDVISDPVPQVQVGSATVTSGSRRVTTRDLNGGLTGTIGNLLKIEANGFNPASLYGNVAVWTSLVDGETFEVSGIVWPDPADSSQQIFSTVIPPLSVGQATLMLRNESTGSTVGPFNVTIETGESLSGSAEEIIDRFLTDTINYFNGLPASPEEAKAISTAVMELTQTQNSFQELIKNGPTPQEQQGLNDLALLIQNSSVYTVEGSRSLVPSGYDADARFSDVLGFLGGVAGYIGGIAGAIAATTALGAVAAGLGIVVGALAIPFFACKLIRGGSCFGDPPSDPSSQACSPSQSSGGSGTTGMGAAPPPGGNGCGNARGGSNSLRGGNTTAGRYLVKLFSGGSSIPFTGVSDAGGYFFIPLIPEAEPFTAIAFDTTTGETRTFEGTGPAIGDSVFMFFDFLSEAEPVGTPIEIGDVVNGEISEAGEIDIYSFSAQAGQQVYFDLQDQSGISQVDWQLVDRTATVVFDTCLGCTEPGVQTLTQGGTYTLIVGEGGNNQTGTYQLQLWNVPAADEFTINIGDIVSDGNPAAGAGNIESPGVKDIYTFNASAGQQVFFDLQEQSGISQIDWQVVDEDGTVIFETCLACSDPGVQTLTRGGTYTLTVGDDRDDGFGTYSFQIIDQSQVRMENSPVPISR